MPKLVVKVNDLVDGEAQYLSLVGSGANGLPFKRFKGENIMDFDRWFRKHKAAPATEGPEVLALIVSDKASDEIVETLKTQGFDLDSDGAVKGDNSTVYPQVECDLDDEEEPRIAYKVHPDVVVLHRVEKQFQPFSGSTSFKENLASEGFFPKAQIATEVFQGTIAEIMFQADDKNDAATRLKTEGTAFVNTLADLVGALPGRTFKLEAALDEVEKSVERRRGEPKLAEGETLVDREAGKPAPVAVAEPEPVAEAAPVEEAEPEVTEPAATPEVTEPETEPDAGFSDPLPVTDPITDPVLKTEPVTEPVAKTEAPDAQSVADLVLAALAPKFDKIESRLAGAETRMKEVNTALTGSATVSDLGDEDDAGEPAQLVVPAFIDSAMDKYRNPDRRIL